MSQVAAATSILLIFGTSNLATLIAAYAADAFLGKFCTVLVASFLKLMVSVMNHTFLNGPCEEAMYGFYTLLYTIRSSNIHAQIYAM